MEYSAQEIAKIVQRFQTTAEKLVANKTSAMRAAAELNLLKATEAVRDVCLAAVKDSSEVGRDQLVSVFGGSCEKIGRLLAVLDSVDAADFTGDNAKDMRWESARESIVTVKAILEQMGVFKIWCPGKEKLPPSELSLQGLLGRYQPGDKIQIAIQCEGGDATEYSIDKPLPAGLRFDKRAGKITGRCDSDLPDLTFTVQAKNDNGATDVELILRMGPPPPSLLTYEVPIKVKLGAVVEWKPAFDGVRCTMEVHSPMPDGLVLDKNTGVMSGRLVKIGDWRWTVKAANVNGAIEASLTVVVADTRIAEEICRCSDLEELMKLEPDRTPFMNWMIWMVHRVHLNDPTLTELNFTNMAMPPPKVEPRIAAKLMLALANNTHLEKLLLASSKMRPPSGMALAEALRRNSTLRVLNVETNLLTVDAIQACAKALEENVASNLEEWRFSNQAGIANFGDKTEEIIAGMMKSNKRILKLGFAIQNGGHRSTIDRCILQNADHSRRRMNAGA